MNTFLLSSIFCRVDRVHVLEDRSLVLENVDLSDEGEYRCEADNVVGSASAVGSLVIQCMFSFVYSFLILLAFFVRKIIYYLLK